MMGLGDYPPPLLLTIAKNVGITLLLTRLFFSLREIDETYRQGGELLGLSYQISHHSYWFNGSQTFVVSLKVFSLQGG